jgi:hypothetical protein
MRGFIFWKGPSPIDRAPLVAIATLKSENDKTGDMLQTWILRQDMHPVEARTTGGDRSFCGDCSIKHQCYVEWGKAPSSIWQAFRRDAYVDLRRKPSLIRRFSEGREVRLGAAGDPAMLPLSAWDNLLIRARQSPMARGVGAADAGACHGISGKRSRCRPCAGYGLADFPSSHQSAAVAQA